MTARLKLLPNLLTSLRLLLLPVLWLCALQGRSTWIGVGLLVALLTDVLDGAAARWLKQETALGARLDSLADKLLTLSALAWLALLFPAIFTDHPLLIGLVSAALAASWLTGFFRAGRMPRLHLVSARVGGGLQGLFALHTFVSGRYSPALLYLALGAGLLAALEEIAVQIVEPHADEQIRTLFEPTLRPRLSDLARRWLAARTFPLALAVAAMALTLPALATGWHFDDYLHRAALTGSGAHSLDVALNDLFVFMDGDPARTQQLIESGQFPWWALPEGKNAFWRPIAGLTHWLDYQLWPRSPLLMHVHSLLWFGALVLVVALLYRRLIGAGWLAGLAALLYALDDARGYAASWIANRNALIATICCCLTIIAHDHWRRDGRRWGGLAAPILLLLGLLSAEAAVATLGYLLAYALVLDRGDRRRLIALLPALLTTLVWRLSYRALGYGAFGTSYIDPGAEPLRFIAAIGERGPVLLLGQWALPPAELYPFLTPPASWLLWLLALLVLGLLLVLVWPLIQRDRLARFWALGMLLATIPACSALPANRLLGVIGLGAMGLLARLLADLPRQRGSWRRSAGLVLAALHLVCAPLLLPLTAYSPALFGAIEPAIHSLPHDPALTQQTAIFVTAPSFFSVSYLSLIRSGESLAAPARTRFLAPALAEVELSRPDAYTLRVRPTGGYLNGFDTVFRDRGVGLVSGQQIVFSDVRVSVVRLTADGRPAEVEFRFAAPLESAALRWFVWRDDAFVPFVPPPVGATIRLEPAALCRAGC
ncbi:MAG TPA: CDP-alcohol phosphatidyltransferase family protein [Herpetosiphonaceae bacterium]